MHNIIKNSWKKINKALPLETLVALNPLQGFVDMKFQDALQYAYNLFQLQDLPLPMRHLNKVTIKWLQILFDQGQARIYMPLHQDNLYQVWKKIIQYDPEIHAYHQDKKEWIAQLPDNSYQAIVYTLSALHIQMDDQELFLTLLLTSLSGWAAHIKHCAQLQDFKNMYMHTVSEEDYIAIRLITIYLIWPEAQSLLDWYKHSIQSSQQSIIDLKSIIAHESRYRDDLITKISLHHVDTNLSSAVQLVFCIDPRSESIRRNIEILGNYETYSLAGFFGLPLLIRNACTNNVYASCPLMVNPVALVDIQKPCILEQNKTAHSFLYQCMMSIKNAYKGLKYNIITSFGLVEMLGPFVAVWSSVKTFFPIMAGFLKQKATVSSQAHDHRTIVYDIDTISFTDQCTYAENALRSMGLVKNFAPYVVLCGHVSSSENNIYKSMLNCAACAARPGDVNASVLVKILNRIDIRQFLVTRGIYIPQSTLFITAQHNTTTDEVVLYTTDASDIINQLKEDLKVVQALNSNDRCQTLVCNKLVSSKLATYQKSVDWAEIRPEWGLAKNASFIIGPRYVTQDINLQSRSFLHSYDYRDDAAGDILRNIFAGPVMVAHGINMQYFFSALDNVAYGGGSKVTINAVGRFHVMQGNASDLMTGLPLQSVYAFDHTMYHELQRLLVVIYAPQSFVINQLFDQRSTVELLENDWMYLVVVDPEKKQKLLLHHDLTSSILH